jgi:hypothetical protein
MIGALSVFSAPATIWLQVFFLSLFAICRKGGSFFLLSPYDTGTKVQQTI